MFLKKQKKNKKYSEFVPINAQKYVGRYPIIIRSSWERLFCQWLDVTPTVLQWSSENIAIPYYDPVQMKNRRYYPDFWMKIKNREGGPTEYIVEIKPAKETKPPTKRGRKSKKTRLFQESTWVTNQAKFRAAEKYCRKMGYKFKIMTEKNLFHGNS
jgi:hypothetical protein